MSGESATPAGDTPDAGGLAAKLATLPDAPGVYVFFDARGDVVYVGKAKSLKKRVRSYFTGRHDGRAFFDSIVGETEDLHCIVTNTEKEAYLLEATLIGENKPRYNVVFRDDKQYVSLRIPLGDEFPGLYRVRGHRDDGALYIGPFDSVAALRETLSLVQKVFPLRTCRDGRFANRTRPCLKFQVGRCAGPCTGEIDARDYRKIVDDAVLFLTGRRERLTARLRERMEEASASLAFERAAALRDQIRAVERTVEQQHVVVSDRRDRDAFGFAREGDAAAVQILFVRDGRLVQAHARCFRTTMPDADLLLSIVNQYYARSGVQVPEEVLLPFPVEDREALRQVLAERRGRSVDLRVPRRGERRAVVALAGKNAWYALSRWEERTQRRKRAVDDLEKQLWLSKPPLRVECFDVSNFGASDVVGSMVTFVDGEADKGAYRRFRLRAGSLDDPSRMAEIVRRRYRRPGTLPDLVVVDGGAAQLAAARAELQDLGLDLEAVGLAKERRSEGRETKPERVYLPGRAEPVRLVERSPGLHLLQRIRDEAHRFAVTYHRKLRRARTLKSGLEEVPGIGPRRRKGLLGRFKSLKKIREATVEELAEAPSMTRRAAERLWQYLRDEGGLHEDTR